MGVIFGSQGDGKTSLATQIGMHVAISRRCLMFQHEMSDEAIATRSWQRRPRSPHRRSRRARWIFLQREQLLEAEERLKASEFFIYDEGEMTIRQMKAQALA